MRDGAPYPMTDIGLTGVIVLLWTAIEQPIQEPTYRASCLYDTADSYADRRVNLVPSHNASPITKLTHRTF